MKALFLNGSPRKSQNTAQLLQRAQPKRRSERLTALNPASLFY